MSAETLLAEFEPDDDLDDLRLRLLATRGPVDMALFGSGSPEACESYEEAVALCRRKGLTTASCGFQSTGDRGSPLRAARPRPIRGDRLGPRDYRRPRIKLQALHCSWATQFHAGRHQDSSAPSSEASPCTMPNRRSSIAPNTAVTTRVCALAERGQSQWFTGTPRRPRVSAKLDWAEESGASRQYLPCPRRRLAREPFRPESSEVVRLSVRMCEMRTPTRCRTARPEPIFSGRARALDGEPEVGAALFETGLDHQFRIGTEEDLRSIRHAVGDPRMPGTSRPRPAGDRRGPRSRQPHQRRLLAPELYRRRAVLRTRCGWPARKIRQDLRQALQLAEDQEADALARRIRADLEAVQAAEPAPSLRG